MERSTAVQAVGVFVATLAAGLPLALEAGEWIAGAPRQDAPTVVETVYVVDVGETDGRTVEPSEQPVRTRRLQPAPADDQPRRTPSPTPSPSAEPTPSPRPSDPGREPVPTPTQPPVEPPPPATPSHEPPQPTPSEESTRPLDA